MVNFQYIKKPILDPLGLKNTFGSIHDVNMDDLMSGYYVGMEDDIKDGGLWFDDSDRRRCRHFPAGLERWVII